jgi:small subunit ribosomal protein S21e
MQNDAGVIIDLYIPRKCSWTNKLITAKDHAAVQINVGKVDPSTGRYTGKFDTFALCGFIRDKAESDIALSALIERAESK